MLTKIKSSILTLLFSALRTVVLYLLFIAFAAFSTLILSFSFTFDPSISGLYNEKMHAFVSTLPLLLAFYNFSRIFILYDTKARNAFFEKNKGWGFFKDVKALLTVKQFWLQILCLSLLAAILPTSFGFTDALHLLFGSHSLSELQLKLRLLAILLPMFVIVKAAAYVSVHRFWHNKRKEFRELDIKWYIDAKGIVSDVVIQFIVISIIAYLLPPMVSVALIVWQTLSFTALPVIKIIIPIIVLYYTFFYIRALTKRRKFIDALQKTCKAQRLSLSEIRSPLKSVFKLKPGFDFSVTADGTTYDCKLLSGTRPGTSIVFTPNGGLLAVPIKFIKYEFRCFFFKFEYRFESENKKVIVIAPVPSALYEKDYHPRAEMDPGGTVYGYHIQNASGFIGGLERGTLSKQ